MENGIWSEITFAYPGGFSLVLEEIMCDENNNLHGVAWYNNTQQPYYHSQTAYIKYDDLNSSWIDPTAISPITYGDNIFGIDVDEFGNPHVAYRQKTPLTGPDNDSTMYTFYNGTEWEIPELIVEDPLEQSIIMDHNNKANIFNTEKIESGKRLVTYYKTGNEWMGYIIDEAEYNISQVKTIAKNSSIYVVYVHSVTGGTGEIYFSQSDMISSSKNTFTSNATLQVSPNPFNKECRIICSTDKKDYTSVKIYSFSGLLINTLLEGYYTDGSFELLWNGKDQNGKEVKSGTYLVRLISGRHVKTKSLVFVK
jgi:hypothetical protein